LAYVHDTILAGDVRAGNPHGNGQAEASFGDYCEKTRLPGRLVPPWE